MEILSLEIQNFLTIGKSTKLNLSNQGLVLIQGVNLDDTSQVSNGAGKSTIADALCWSLFDETARGDTGDSVVNDKMKKDTYASVVLLDGDTHYKITRYRKHHEFKNRTIVEAWVNGAPPVEVSKGTEKETQELIVGIMGCSLSVFVAAIYAGQEAMPDLPKMTDKQLKLLIEEAAGVERLETAYELARADFNTLQAESNTYVASKNRQLVDRADYAVKLESVKALLTMFEDTRTARANEHKRLAIELVNLTKTLALDLGSKQPDALKTRLAELHTQVANVRMLEDNYKGKVVHANNCKMEASNHEVVMSGVMAEMKKYQFAHDNAEVEMAKPCHACGKAHDTSEVLEFRAHQVGKLMTLGENYSLKQGKLAMLKEAAIIAEGWATVAEKELQKLNPTDVLRESTEINQQLNEITALENKIAANKKEIQVYIERSNLANSEENPNARTVAYVTAQLQTAEARIKEAAESLVRIEGELEIANAVMKVFSPAGVRAHILDTVTPFLNERTSDYLSTLSDGNIQAVWTTISKTAKGDLREKFNIEVSNDKGGKSFRSQSGGEKRKVRLATMLALQDLVASRAAKPINLWVGDEIDDAIDPAGLERLMAILEVKARDRGTVLIISHNSLSDWVDNSITITKENGVSTIEGYLCQ